MDRNAALKELARRELERRKALRVEQMREKIKANPAEYDPNSKEFKAKYGTNADSSFLHNLAVGNTSAFHRLGTNLGNMVGLVDDERAKEVNRIGREIEETGGGFTGSLVGQVAATAPVGFGVAGGASRLASMAPKLAGGLGLGAGAAAVEGGLNSALYADPGQRLQAGATGAVVGGGLNLAGRAAGRGIRGLVKKSDDALALETMARNAGEDIFIPVTQGASKDDKASKIISGTYRNLDVVPFVRGQFQNQADEAEAVFRRMALKEAAGELSGQVPVGRIGDGAEKATASAVRRLKGDFNNVYDEVKKYVFRIPENWSDDVVESLRKGAAIGDEIPEQYLNEVKDILDDTLRARVKKEVVGELLGPGSGTKDRVDTLITGYNLLDAKNALQKRIKALGNSTTPGAARVKSLLEKARAKLDDIVSSDIAGTRDLRMYKAANQQYPELEAIRKAAISAKRNMGNFTPGQLAASAPLGTHNKTLADISTQVLGQSASGTNKYLRSVSPWMFSAGLGATVMGGGLSLPGAAAVVGGGNALASRTAQKFLYGDTATQMKIAEFLRKNPKFAAEVGAAMRRAATTETGENFNAP
jgi:hypothetical protein